MRSFFEKREYYHGIKVWTRSYEDIGILPHWHPEIEMIYVETGRAQIRIGEHTLDVSAGDLVIADTGDLHSCPYSEKGSRLRFLLFDPAVLTFPYHYQNFGSHLLSADQLRDAGLDGYFMKEVLRLQQELQQQDAYFREVVQSTVQNLWLQHLRLLPAGNSGAQSAARPDLQSSILQLQRYIGEHYAENLTLADAAQQLNFSPCHFSRIFREQTGVNYIRYLNITRVSQAAEQLSNGSKSITQVAMDCGFNSVRSFNRTFKEIMGCTPSAFIARKDLMHAAFFFRSGALQQTTEEQNPTIVNLGT